MSKPVDSPNKRLKKRQRPADKSAGPSATGTVPDDALYNQTPSPAASVAPSTTTTVTEVHRPPSQHAFAGPGHSVSTGLSAGISKLKIEHHDRSDSEMAVVPRPAAVSAQPTKRIVRGDGRFKLKRKNAPRLPAENPSAASTPVVPVSANGASVNTASSAPAPRSGNAPSIGNGLTTARASGPVSASSQHPGSHAPRRNLGADFDSTSSVSSSTRNSSCGEDVTYAGYDAEGFHFEDTDVDTALKLVLQETNWYVRVCGIRVTEFFNSLCVVLTCRDVQYRSFNFLCVTDCVCAGSRSKRRRPPPVDRTGPGTNSGVAGASSP